MIPRWSHMSIIQRRWEQRLSTFILQPSHQPLFRDNFDANFLGRKFHIVVPSHEWQKSLGTLEVWSIITKAIVAQSSRHGLQHMFKMSGPSSNSYPVGPAEGCHSKWVYPADLFAESSTMMWNYFLQSADSPSANSSQKNPECYEFGQKISECIENDPELLDCLFFSDEAHFHLSGHVNRQNCRFWAIEQPHEHSEKLVSVEKTTVWCVLGKNGILGPYFFEDDDGHQVTVNTDQYIEMLRRCFILALRGERGFDLDTVVFQQDGAPPHFRTAPFNTSANTF